MKTYRITIKALSAFGTPLVGDSLFGQLCWAIVNQENQQKLTALLQGYTSGNPFLVLSDAFPKGYLPLPHLPSRYWQEQNGIDRKVLKKKQWIAIEDCVLPVEQWQQKAKAEKELINNDKPFKVIAEHYHNTIRRDTATTGTGQFAPYTMSQIWYQKDQQFDIYAVLDEQRFSVKELEETLKYIGLFGFGRDASIGLGKFSVESVSPFSFATQNGANCYLTLANTAPQGLGLNKSQCYYQITTRFGRHGDQIALSDNPFKKPIILAKAGAVFTPNQWQDKLFLGNGVSGISYVQPESVHQGYAPVIPLVVNFQPLG